MGQYKVNLKDLFFILKEQLHYGSLNQFPRYRDLDEKTFDLLINEAARFAEGVVDPLNEIGESHGARFNAGQVN